MKIDTKQPICRNCGAEGRDLYNDGRLIIRFCSHCGHIGRFVRVRAAANDKQGVLDACDRWDTYARLEGFLAGVSDAGITDKSLLFPPKLGGAQ